MRYIFIILLTLFFSACSTKESSFILPTTNVVTLKSIKTQIGVKKINVPDYLNSDKILVKNGSKLESIDANFASSADSLFTQKAIVTLKKALNNPNVFLYPWEVSKKKGYIVEINIDDYLYSNGMVNLNGTYYIKNANGQVISAKNFAYSKPANKDANSIVNALNELFNNLIIEIAQKIAR